ncbi:MAG: phosphoribosyltransferase [Patescibacteria group bacterium]
MVTHSSTAAGAYTAPVPKHFPNDSTDYLLLTWDDVMSSAIALARRIVEHNGEYDRLITLGKGGWPLARILADLLQLPDAASLGISFYDGLERKEAPMLSQELPASISGQKVILVDDVVDSGDSIEFARKYLVDLGVKKVDTASLYYKPRSSYKPDFFAESTTAWIIFPHEYLEGIIGLTKKWQSKGVGQSEILRRLEKLEVPAEMLRYHVEIASLHT